MNTPIDNEKVYAVSEDFVAREIEDELIIVPISGGMGDLEDGLFTMNETGKAIWDKIDGIKTVNQIADSLNDSFDGREKEILKDVSGFLTELFNRGMIIER